MSHWGQSSKLMHHVRPPGSTHKRAFVCACRTKSVRAVLADRATVYTESSQILIKPARRLWNVPQHYVCRRVSEYWPMCPPLRLLPVHTGTCASPIVPAPWSTILNTLIIVCSLTSLLPKVVCPRACSEAWRPQWLRHHVNLVVLETGEWLQHWGVFEAEPNVFSVTTAELVLTGDFLFIPD